MLFITLALLAVLAVMRIVQLGGFRARLARIISIPELGALTLAEANLSTNNPIVPGIVETFVKESPVIDRIQFKDISGNAYKYNEELALPGVEFRAVNAAYSESTGTINPKTESIVILGGDADVDTFLVKTGGNLADLRATQDKMKAKAAAYKFDDTFINGDTAVDANSFDGLKKRLTGAQVIVAGVNGLSILGAADADRHAFLDQLDLLIAQVLGINASNGALYMNAAVKAKIASSARRLTIYDQTVDSFGRHIQTYNGIPLLDIGNKGDGTLVIPQTETTGTSAVTSSIYAVKFGSGEGEGSVCGLQNGTIDVRDLGEQQVKPVYRTRLEWFVGLGVFSGRAAARLTGVLAT